MATKLFRTECPHCKYAIRMDQIAEGQVVACWRCLKEYRALPWRETGLGVKLLAAVILGELLWVVFRV